MKKLLFSLCFLITNLYAKEIIVSEPVEHKVVEIHMTTAAKEVIESKKRNKKDNQIPVHGHGTCSGAFIDNIGDILTARHCIDGFDTFEVVTYENRKYTAIVVATSTIHDLALIHIDKLNTPYFKIAAKVERGQSVSVLGSPLGITDTLTKGIIARIDGDVFLLDCSVLPGNSGGPVYNDDGQMVGIVNAVYIVFMGTTHLSITQGIDAIYFFLSGVFARR